MPSNPRPMARPNDLDTMAGWLEGVTLSDAAALRILRAMVRPSCPTPAWGEHDERVHYDPAPRGAGVDAEPDFNGRCRAVIKTATGAVRCAYPRGHGVHENGDLQWSVVGASADARIESLTDALHLALDFFGADTEVFVAKYGAGMTTRGLCDRLRAALAEAPDGR
jgi:hypothetical protein